MHCIEGVWRVTSVEGAAASAEERGKHQYLAVSRAFGDAGILLSILNTISL